MNIRDLQYMVAVAKLSSFSAAAAHCHTTQPTLSIQLKKLEQSLGVQIFERNNRNVMLTAVGEDIVAAAKRVLCDVDEITTIADLSQDPYSGMLRLGAFPTLAPYYFPQAVPRICAKLPKLKLILHEEKTDELVRQLTNGELDVALLALPIDDKQFESECLFTEEFVLFVPQGHELAMRTAISQQDLIGETLMLLEEGHCFRDQALEVCGLLGANEEQSFRATSIETLRHMVVAGSGITLMPKLALNDTTPTARVVPFEKPPVRTIGLVWRKTSSRKALIQRLLTVLKGI